MGNQITASGLKPVGKSLHIRRRKEVAVWRTRIIESPSDTLYRDCREDQKQDVEIDVSFVEYCHRCDSLRHTKRRYESIVQAHDGPPDSSGKVNLQSRRNQLQCWKPCE